MASDHGVEVRFFPGAPSMSDTPDQIQQIEKEIRETPYHKGTEHHVGKLRARLARLKDRELEAGVKKGGGGGGGYAVKKQGDATVVLIGPPSTGKSTLLNALTNAESKVAPYAFTTVSVIPGMMLYEGAYIQILDIPGLIEGARQGKGRGREVLSVARGADLLLIMTDVERVEKIPLMIEELEGAGIRINKTAPAVLIDKKPGGGLILHSNIKQDLSKETIKEVAGEFGIKNGDITIKEKLTMETLLDAFSTSRAYIAALFIINKVDLATKNFNELIHRSKPILISAEEGTDLETLKEKIWETLGLIKVYLVRPDDKPNMESPIIMKSGQILKDVAEKIGTDFAENKKLAKIWGPGAHFPGQEVSLALPIKEGMQIRFLI